MLSFGHCYVFLSSTLQYLQPEDQKYTFMNSFVTVVSIRNDNNVASGLTTSALIQVILKLYG